MVGLKSKKKFLDVKTAETLYDSIITFFYLTHKWSRVSGPNKFTQVWLIYVPFWNDELLCTLNERNQNADKPQRDIPYSDAYDLICIWESVLETNYFEFNRKYCKQIIDCSMGAITSPEISDTKMYQFTNHFMSKLKFANQDLYHRRFRDDGFLAFNGT